MHLDSQKQFTSYINQHSGIIHRICRIYFADKNNRQDAFQEIIYQLWKSYPSFKHESKFSTWMYKVALNTAINQIRKEKKEIQKEPLRDRLAEVTAAVESESEQIQSLYEAINTLSLGDKAIILLYLEDNSYEDIAMITGLTKSNVSVRLVRIRKKLEEKLKSN
jgi:RNA polymerase sigma-70 factor (ECF subfamily)